MTETLLTTLSFLALVSINPLAFAGNGGTGHETFQKYCSSCHGPVGAGDGPVGKTLPQGTIPSFKKASFKYAQTDEKMSELIRKGGGAVGLSPLMPAHPTLKDEEITALVEYVNTLSK
jgi:mono/diheme cytochrome c family protein